MAALAVLRLGDSVRVLRCSREISEIVVSTYHSRGERLSRTILRSLIFLLVL